MATTPSMTTPYQVYAAGAFWADISNLCPNSRMTDTLRTQLASNGFTKFLCPYGLLIAGTSTYPDANLIYAANTYSELLDLNNDGIADNTSLASTLKNTVWAVGGTSQATEDACDNVSGFSACFGLQSWKETDTTASEAAAKIVREEIVHMVHQWGWAKLWPSDLGVDDFTTSVTCREMARLECVSPGWWHAENTCTNAPRSAGNAQAPPLTGTCSEANCDCVEFFHQALLTNLGQTAGWYSDYMPQTQAGMQSLLSTEMKNMLADTSLGLPQSPIDGNYSPSAPVTKSERGKGLIANLSMIGLLASSVYLMQ